MKISTLIILVLLGVAGYALLNPGKKKGPAPGALAPARSATSATSAASVASATPAGTAASEPMPAVHVSKLAIVRGQVVDLIGDRAAIDCDYVAKPSAAQQARLRQMAEAASGGAAAPGAGKLSQAELDRQTFGQLQLMGEDGKLHPAPAALQRPVKGRVMLSGLDLRKGGFVHVLAAPLSIEAGVPVYTARFKVTGGAWMFNDRQNPLDRKP